MNTPGEPAYISIGEAAHELRVHLNQVGRYISQGTLKVYAPVFVAPDDRHIPAGCTGIRLLDCSCVTEGSTTAYATAFEWLDSTGKVISTEISPPKPPLGLPRFEFASKFICMSAAEVRNLKGGKVSEPPPSPPRHEFTAEERVKGSRKGCLQIAVERYLDSEPEGTWEGFKNFLNDKLKLSKEETLFNDQTYNFYFEKVNKNGVYLHQPKQRDSSDNRYLPSDVGSIIRKEKKLRKK
jgi:hypothetical protein